MKPPSVIIDLHLDSFIWTRILGYDLFKRHRPGVLGGRFARQVDLPRLKDAGITGAMWSITTNPFRTSKGRAKAFEKNFVSFQKLVESHSEAIKFITSPADFEAAHAARKHAVWLSVQGGNAFDHDPESIGRYAPTLTRVTLIHLTHSSLGTSSMPYPSFQKCGLAPRGRELVDALKHHRVFVDLAHADPQTFWDVARDWKSDQPLIVTHTGASQVHSHWRNLDDAQIKRVADTGGVIGVLFHAAYLGTGTMTGDAVLDHLEHIHRIAGEDFSAIGSDWDGMIVPPKDLRDCVQLPGLIERMDQRGWSTGKIEKTLGLNFLRTFKQLRPDSSTGES